MNRKQLLILIVVGVIVGAIGIAVKNKQRSAYVATDTTSGQKVLPNFPLNEVAQLRVKQAAGEVNLVRTNETWLVQERWGYPANFSEVSTLLRKIWELKPMEGVQVGPSQFARLELVQPSEGGSTNTGTLIEFKDSKGGAMKGLLLGKKHTRNSGEESPFGGGGSFPVGRYVMVPDAQPKVWLVSETFNEVEPKPENWLDKEFFKVEKTKSVSVTYPEETNSWTLARETETGEWKLQNPAESEQLDTSKASSLNYALNSPSFNDIAAPDLKPEDTGLDKPIVAKLETFDGFVYTLNVSSKTNAENLYLKVNVAGNFATERTAVPDEKPEDKAKLDQEFKDALTKKQEKLKNEQRFANWTYLVSKWTVDSLLKPRKDLLADKKPDAAAAPAAPVRDPSEPPVDLLPPELKNAPIPPTPQ